MFLNSWYLVKIHYLFIKGITLVTPVVVQTYYRCLLLAEFKEYF